MLSLLSHLFSALAPLWEMSLTGAYVAVVVLLLRLALKNRAPRQAVCLLWLIVFARLLLPISLESPFSAVPQALTDVPAAQTMGLDDAASQGQPAGTGEDTTVPPESVSNAPSGGPITQPVNPGTAIQNPGQTVQTPNQTAASFPWQALASGVWLAGVLAMAGYALISYLLLRRRLFDAVRASDGAWEHPGLSTPFLLGVVRPRIYLPAHLPAKTRFFVLAHERTHLRRLDHIVKPVCWLALSLHWFNPVAWLAFFLLSRDLEVACDQSVVRRLGSQVKADYSAALLSVAAPRRFPTPCPLAFGGNNTKGRIQNVLNYKKPTLWILVVVVIAVISAAVCLLTDPMAEQPGPDATDSASPSASPSLEPATTLPPGAELLFENQSDGLALYRQSRTPFTTYLVAGDSVQELPYSVSDTVTDLRLADLDGDGAEELSITSRFYAGAGGQGELRVLEWVDGQWDVDGMSGLLNTAPSPVRDSIHNLLDSAAFTHELGNPNVTMSLTPGLELAFTVSDELSQIQGTYVVSSSSATDSIFWWGDVPYLRLNRYLELYPDPGGDPTSYGTDVRVELLSRLFYSSDGTLSQSPVALYPACDRLSTLSSQDFADGAAVEIIESGTFYYEDAMTLLSFLPEAGAYLYVTPNGQHLLRSGAYIGPVPEEVYPDTASSVRLALGTADDRGVTLYFSSVQGALHAFSRLEPNQEGQGWQWAFSVALSARENTNGPLAATDTAYTLTTPHGSQTFQGPRQFSPAHTLTYRADLDGDGAEEYLFLPTSSDAQLNSCPHELYLFDGNSLEEYDVPSQLWEDAGAGVTFRADADSLYLDTADGLSVSISKAELLENRYPARDVEQTDAVGLHSCRFLLKNGQVYLYWTCDLLPQVHPAFGDLQKRLLLEDGAVTTSPFTYTSHLPLPADLQELMPSS